MASGIESSAKKKIVLIGASVGAAWNLDELSSRTNDNRFEIEYIGEYDFDKSKRLREILDRKDNRPEAIIIKECAAYFPGDVEKYKKLIIKWVEECEGNNVRPILATVVPVSRLHSLKQMVKLVLKMKNPFINSRIKGINEFNDWVRGYARTKNLLILDLERALREGDKARYLKKEFDSGDGLHVNNNAYRVMDHVLLSTLLIL